MEQEYSELWMSMRFNELRVLGGGEFVGSRRDVAPRMRPGGVYHVYVFLQLIVYGEFLMGTVQMVVAIPLCCGRLVFPYFCNIGHFLSLNDIPWSLDS